MKAVRRLESLTMLRKSPSVSPSISPSTSVAKLTDEVAINSSNGNNHQNKTTNAVNSDENHSSTSEMNKENNEKVVNHEEETGSSSHDETAAAPLVNNVDGNSDENEDGGITMKVNKSKPEIPVLEVNDIVASNDDVS